MTMKARLDDAVVASWRSEPVLRWGARAWAAVGIVVAGYLLLRLLLVAQVLLAPLLVALVLVYLLNPIVGALHRRGLPRPASTAVAALTALAVLGVGAVVLAPVLVDQFRAALATLPSDLETVEAWIDQAAANLGLDVNVNLDGTAAQRWFADAGNRGLLLGSLTTIGSAAASAAGALIALVAGAILALFVLGDLPGLRRAALGLVPPAHRAEVSEVAGDVGLTVGGFLRGQILVAGFVGIASALALWLVGLPLWLLVGAVAGVTNLVPFVGPFVGGALAVVIALVDGNLSQAVWAAVAVLVVQQVESYAVSPLVMGKVVQLHPAAVILVVLLGGSLAGLVGLLLAVPLAASSRVIARHLWHRSVNYAGDSTPRSDATGRSFCSNAEGWSVTAGSRQR